eukprot:1366748-Prymnesium_polylepis.1
MKGDSIKESSHRTRARGRSWMRDSCDPLGTQIAYEGTVWRKQGFVRCMMVTSSLSASAHILIEDLQRAEHPKGGKIADN